LETCRQDSDWMCVTKYMLRVVSILDMCQRGRIISLVKSHALLGNACSTSMEEKVCGGMREVLEIKSQALIPKIAMCWPVVQGLFGKDLCYRDNAELCKVVHMCMKCLPLIATGMRQDFSAWTKYVVGVTPSENWIEECGIIDQHVLGLTRCNQMVFLGTGMLTKNTCEFQIGGLNIAALEANYVKQKQDMMCLAQAATGVAEGVSPSKKKRTVCLNLFFLNLVLNV